MKSYELNIIASPDLGDEGAKSLAESMLALVSEAEGSVNETKNPNRVRLGYPLQKRRDGYLISLMFSLSSEKIEEIKAKLSENKSIIRFLVLDKKPIPLEAPRSYTPREKESEKTTEKKVELKEIEEKLEEILSE